MRPITRGVLTLVVLVVLALLALGALPSYLGTGDPYYLTATPTDEAGPSLNVTNASTRRYPYLTTALTSDDGRSEGYQRGPFGIKESFTHSPFDEFDALAGRDPDAYDGEAMFVEYEGQRYRVEVTRG